ncbi:MAG: hypothetical protein IH861_08140 [Chloroflexi bacterium]|nr:hypothetical protein [Chloroflexota bacterium]
MGSSSVGATVIIGVESLELSLNAQGAVDVGETFDIQVALINTGNTIINDVEASLHLPEGIGISSEQTQSAGTISPGNETSIGWNAISNAPGSYVIMVTAIGTVEDGDTSVIAQATIIVVVLETSTTGGGGGGGVRISPNIGFRPQSFTFTAVLGEGNPEPQIFEVFTTRNRSVLRFTIKTDVSWLGASPIEGISDAKNDREHITIPVDMSGLDVGTHTGRILISARRARNDPQFVPVILVILSPPVQGVISESRVAIDNNETVEIVTPNGQVQVRIPRGALPDEVFGDVEVELRNIDVASVPDAPDGTFIVRAIELNTLIDGEMSPVDYTEPVELAFVLTQEDMDLVEGDTSRLTVLWLNDETGEWEVLPVTYESNPPAAGRLVTLLDHFSVYAIGVLGEAEPEEEQVTVAPTAAQTPTPTATRVPTAVPTPTVRVVVTLTPAPVISTTVAVAQTTAPPAPNVTPQSTATAVSPAPAVPAAPVSPSQPPAEPQTALAVQEPVGIGATTIVILIVVGTAVLAGIAAVAQGIWARRRET